MTPLLTRYDAAHLTFDRSGLTFLDAGAIGQLVIVRNGAGGGRLNLVGVPVKMRWLLHILQADDLFNVRQDTDEATRETCAKGTAGAMR